MTNIILGVNAGCMSLRGVTVLCGVVALAVFGCGQSSRSDDAAAGGTSPGAGTGGQSSAGQSRGGQSSAGRATGGSSAGGPSAGGPSSAGSASAGRSAAGRGGSAGSPPEECFGLAGCGDPPETGPCAAVAFEDSGDDCVKFAWAWNGDACAETSYCECVSGQCDRLFGTAVECQKANAECVGATNPAPDPSCAPTAFESTDDGCVETSWLWDGSQCVSSTHCGCSSGDCDRLYDDYRSCSVAHAACLPSGCRAQDAMTGANMCGTLLGYAFNGWDCRAVICQCFGEDCADIADTVEDCQTRFEPCLARTPACLDTRFPVEDSELGFHPTYPEYTFSVEGYDQLYDAGTEAVAVFPEWTAADWVGWEAQSTETAVCPRIDGQRIYVFPAPCPAARTLVLRVAEQTFRVNVSIHWSLVTDPFSPTQVDVRIVAHPSGSLVLQIRDSDTGQPVVMVVQSLPEAMPGTSSWEFSPFTFTSGDKLCFTEPGECRWMFSPLALHVTATDVDQTIEPLHSATVAVGAAPYAVLHAYIYERNETGEHACVSPYKPRQSFALMQRQGTN